MKTQAYFIQSRSPFQWKWRLQLASEADCFCPRKGCLLLTGDSVVVPRLYSRLHLFECLIFFFSLWSCWEVVWQNAFGERFVHTERVSWRNSAWVLRRESERQQEPSRISVILNFIWPITAIWTARAALIFLPLQKKRLADLNEHKRDVKQIQRLFASVNKIVLMGGEPLLKPQIYSFLFATRTCFPKADM